MVKKILGVLIALLFFPGIYFTLERITQYFLTYASASYIHPSGLVWSFIELIAYVIQLIIYNLGVYLGYRMFKGYSVKKVGMTIIILVAIMIILAGILQVATV